MAIFLLFNKKCQFCLFIQLFWTFFSLFILYLCYGKIIQLNLFCRELFQHIYKHFKPFCAKVFVNNVCPKLSMIHSFNGGNLEMEI